MPDDAPSAELRRTVHRALVETIPNQHNHPTVGVVLGFLSPKVPGIDEPTLRSTIKRIIEEPASGFAFNNHGEVQRRLAPAEIYAMHRDMKQHLAASTLRSPSGLPVVEGRVFVEAMKTLVLTTADRTASRVVAQFYKGVSELFGEEWVEGYVHVRGKKMHGRSLQDLPDKASIVARNRDLIAALEEGSTAVPFPPPAPLPAEAPAVAAPAVQRRGRGVAPKRSAVADANCSSDTEGESSDDDDRCVLDIVATSQKTKSAARRSQKRLVQTKTTIPASPSPTPQQRAVEDMLAELAIFDEECGCTQNNAEPSLADTIVIDEGPLAKQFLTNQSQREKKLKDLRAARTPPTAASRIFEPEGDELQIPSPAFALWKLNLPLHERLVRFSSASDTSSSTSMVTDLIFGPPAEFAACVSALPERLANLYVKWRASVQREHTLLFCDDGQKRNHSAVNAKAARIMIEEEQARRGLTASYLASVDSLRRFAATAHREAHLPSLIETYGADLVHGVASLLPAETYSPADVQEVLSHLSNWSHVVANTNRRDVPPWVAEIARELRISSLSTEERWRARSEKLRREDALLRLSGDSPRDPSAATAPPLADQASGLLEQEPPGHDPAEELTTRLLRRFVSEQSDPWLEDPNTRYPYLTPLNRHTFAAGPVLTSQPSAVLEKWSFFLRQRQWAHVDLGLLPPGDPSVEAHDPFGFSFDNDSAESTRMMRHVQGALADAPAARRPLRGAPPPAKLGRAWGRPVAPFPGDPAGAIAEALRQKVMEEQVEEQDNVSIEVGGAFTSDALLRFRREQRELAKEMAVFEELVPEALDAYEHEDPAAFLNEAWSPLVGAERNIEPLRHVPATDALLNAPIYARDARSAVFATSPNIDGARDHGADAGASDNGGAVVGVHCRRFFALYTMTRRSSLLVTGPPHLPPLEIHPPRAVPTFPTFRELAMCVGVGGRRDGAASTGASENSASTSAVVRSGHGAVLPPPMPVEMIMQLHQKFKDDTAMEQRQRAAGSSSAGAAPPIVTASQARHAEAATEAPASAAQQPTLLPPRRVVTLPPLMAFGEFQYGVGPVSAADVGGLAVGDAAGSRGDVTAGTKALSG